MKFMNEYDSKYWKHGSNITVEQFCSYVMQQIPKDAVFYVCGSSSISLHFSLNSNIFLILRILKYDKKIKSILS